MLNGQNKIRTWLSQAPPTLFSVYCMVAAFGTYFCMYAFRKPFTAATYEGEIWNGVGLKTILVASQVSGYTLSKFIGIKVVSEMSSRYRAVAILGLVGIAEIALLMFALTPAPWNVFWLFINGLPLGMVFGLVLRFLEGRKMTEALSAGLCASFILASGFVKSVGRSLLDDYQVDPFWMPVVTGLLFVAPLLFFVWMLSQIPPPSALDEQSRARRLPMNREHRRTFLRRHLWGLCGLLAIYVMLTLVRSLRDDFAVEIWRELGVDERPSVFAISELMVMLGVVAVNGLAILIRNNRTAFLMTLNLIAAGFLVVLITIGFHSNGILSPMVFMVLLGFGMYVPYVAFHTTVFERMFAAFRETGTVAYLMCLADALGYLVYVPMMAFRDSVSLAKKGNQVAPSETGFLDLMVWASVGTAILSITISVALRLYFGQRLSRREEPHVNEVSLQTDVLKSDGPS